MKLWMLTILVVSGFAFAGAPVVGELDHVVATPTVHIVPTTIKGMSFVSSVYDTGNTAWAVNRKQNLVAFYNGKAWQPATSVPGFTSIDILAPAYPITGKKPEAWALSEDLLSHFDGVSWSEPLDVKKILNLTPPQYVFRYDMQAANGYLFLLAETSGFDGVHFAVYNPTSSSWSAPQILPTVASVMSFDTNNLSTPHAIVGAEAYSVGTVFLVINQDASYYMRSGLNDFGDVISLYDRDYYVSGSNNPDDYYFNYTEPENPNILNTVPFSQLMKEFDFVGLEPYYISKNTICLSGFGQDLKKELIEISCLNIKDIQPQWSPITTLNINIRSYNYVAHDNGAWIITKEGKNNLELASHIYNYDMATSKIMDTNFNAQTHISNSQRIKYRALTSSALVVCIASKKSSTPQKISLFVYDLKMKEPKWIQVNTSASKIKNCSFSYLSGQFNKESTGNFWLY